MLAFKENTPGATYIESADLSSYNTCRSYVKNSYIDDSWSDYGNISKYLPSVCTSYYFDKIYKESEDDLWSESVDVPHAGITMNSKNSEELLEGNSYQNKFTLLQSFPHMYIHYLADNNLTGQTYETSGHSFYKYYNAASSKNESISFITNCDTIVVSRYTDVNNKTDITEYIIGAQFASSYNTINTTTINLTFESAGNTSYMIYGVYEVSSSDVYDFCCSTKDSIMHYYKILNNHCFTCKFESAPTNFTVDTWYLETIYSKLVGCVTLNWDPTIFNFSISENYALCILSANNNITTSKDWMPDRLWMNCDYEWPYFLFENTGTITLNVYLNSTTNKNVSCVIDYNGVNNINKTTLYLYALPIANPNNYPVLHKVGKFTGVFTGENDTFSNLVVTNPIWKNPETTIEFVDLGLPSGTLWNTCNLGSESPELIGNYYTWGDSDQITSYATYTNKYLTSTGYSKFKLADNYRCLFRYDNDPAAVIDKLLSTPSAIELEELINSEYTTVTLSNLNNISGYLITSKINGNSIFMPGTGEIMDHTLDDTTTGYYWSHDLYTATSKELTSANILYLLKTSDSTSYTGINSQPRCYGMPIRPVKHKDSLTISISDNNANLYVGDTLQLTANLTPNTSTYEKPYWESNNHNIATISVDGMVHANSIGSTTVYAASYDGNCLTNCAINVDMKYVDLGLSSGTLWATCNVGATSSTDGGKYFAWGEIKSKSGYSWINYKYANGDYQHLTKYCTDSDYGIVDGQTKLSTTDDVAYSTWNSDWIMPTKDLFIELQNECTWTWSNSGCTLTGPNGNTIFLPANGYQFTEGIIDSGNVGYYYSSNLGLTDYPAHAYYLTFNSTSNSISTALGRAAGFSIRPVRNLVKVSEITLSDEQITLTPTNTYTLTATILPEDAYNKSVSWSSSNTAIAAVSDTGIVTAIASGQAVITVNAVDGSGASATCTVIVKTNTTSGSADDHDYVDLGLPSGTLWATTNIGASKPEYIGQLFAWGETTGYNTYSHNFNDSNYKYIDSSGKLTKYCTNSSYGTIDNLTLLELTDDAAYANWGSNWRIPTKSLWDELIDSKYTKLSNTSRGLCITSLINGNSIILPEGIIREGTKNYEGYYYWSSNLYTNIYCKNAYMCTEWVSNTGYAYLETSYTGRCYGMPIRPVKSKLTEYNYVDMGLSSGTMWATMNVGAYSLSEQGSKFAWGETSTKPNYTWPNYKYCNGTKTSITKYNTSSDYGIVDNLATLEAIDDAATINWDSNWSTPTKDQWSELLNNAYISGKVVEIDGEECIRLYSSKTKNELIIPFGLYWSSTSAYGGNAYITSATSDYITNLNLLQTDRCYGLKIRPVITP